MCSMRYLSGLYVLHLHRPGHQRHQRHRRHRRALADPLKRAALDKALALPSDSFKIGNPYLSLT